MYHAMKEKNKFRYSPCILTSSLCAFVGELLVLPSIVFRPDSSILVYLSSHFKYLGNMKSNFKI